VLSGNEFGLVWDLLGDCLYIDWTLSVLDRVRLFDGFFCDSFLLFCIYSLFFFRLFFILFLFFGFFRVYFLLRLYLLSFLTCMRRLLRFFLVLMHVLQAKFLIRFSFFLLYHLDCRIGFRNYFILGER
jgi:hypothetical protein